MSTPALNDFPVLLRQIAEGDEAAFRTFVEQQGAKIYPYLFRFTHSAEIAEDLSQEIFLKVWIHRDKLPQLLDMQAWLFRITANTARSWLRKELRDRSFLKGYTPLHGTSSGQEILDFNEIQKLLQKAIAALPPKRRRIYQMQRIEGKSISSIAKELNLSTNTVKNALASSTEGIRRYLESFGLMIVLALSCFRK